jgi:hypothetical protein
MLVHILLGHITILVNPVIIRTSIIITIMIISTTSITSTLTISIIITFKRVQYLLCNIIMFRNGCIGLIV